MEGDGAPPARAGSLRPALAALAALVGALLCWAVFVRSAQGQVVDEVAFAGSGQTRGLLEAQARGVLSVVSEGSLVVGMLVAVAVAVARRAWGAAAAAVVVVAGSNVATQVLKALLPRPALGLGAENSLPSGHTTVAASLAVALVLVAPPRLRGAAAVAGAVVAASMGVSTLVAGWHRPSDVVAALLVVAAWTCGVVAVLRRLPARTTPAPSRAPRPAATRVLVVVGALGLLAGTAALVVVAASLRAGPTVVVWSAPEQAGGLLQVLSYAGGASAVVGGAALLTAATTVLLRASR